VGQNRKEKALRVSPDLLGGKENFPEKQRGSLLGRRPKFPAFRKSAAFSQKEGFARWGKGRRDQVKLLICKRLPRRIQKWHHAARHKEKRKKKKTTSVVQRGKGQCLSFQRKPMSPGKKSPNPKGERRKGKIGTSAFAPGWESSFIEKKEGRSEGREKRMRKRGNIRFAC